MSKFKVGDRVQDKDGESGTVVEVLPGTNRFRVRFDDGTLGEESVPANQLVPLETVTQLRAENARLASEADKLRALVDRAHTENASLHAKLERVTKAARAAVAEWQPYAQDSEIRALRAALEDDKDGAG